MGMIMMAVLRGPYPDDPSEMGVVQWMQVLDAMKSAADEIDRLKRALVVADFYGIGVRASNALKTLGWNADGGPDFTDAEFLAIHGAGRKALQEAREYQAKCKR